MSEYSDAVKKLPASADEAGRMPCAWCQTPTLRVTLGQYGRRCLRCYEDYCTEGSRGGRDGFMQGAPDTADQRDMRKHLKDASPAPNVLKRGAEEVDRAAAKREADRHVRDYAARNGLILSDSATLLAGRRNSTPEKARSSFDEPAWLREGESR